MEKFRQEWLSNVRNDVLAGLVVALALIPEAIAFSIIAGVDPKVGLYASFSIAVIIAFMMLLYANMVRCAALRALATACMASCGPMNACCTQAAIPTVEAS